MKFKTGREENCYAKTVENMFQYLDMFIFQCEDITEDIARLTARTLGDSSSSGCLADTSSKNTTPNSTARYDNLVIYEWCLTIQIDCKK